MKVLILLIFIGGAFGAMVREFIMLLVPTPNDAFPLNIFIANIVAAFLLGVVVHRNRLKHVSDEALMLFGTGVLGGMSTFSSFVYGAYSIMTSPKGLLISIGYIAASLICGYIAVWVGFKLAAEAERTTPSEDMVATTQTLERQIVEDEETKKES